MTNVLTMKKGGFNMFEMTPFRRRGLSRRDDFFDKIQSYFDDEFNVPRAFRGDIKIDLKETEKEYIVEADLPGVRKEDIEITYENNYLTIAAKREEVMNEEKENYIRKERNYGMISRSFYVDDIDGDNIKAKFSDGVLKMNLPKKDSPENKNKINIE